MDIKGIHGRAIEFYKQKDYAKAARLFEMMPQVPVVLFNMAMCYRDMGGIENLLKAKTIMTKAVTSKVKDGGLRNQIVDAYVSLMTMIVRALAVSFKLKEALEENMEAIELLPRHPILLYNQGHMHKCLGDHVSALEYLKKSLIYNPQYFDSYIEQINIYNDARNYKLAEKTILEGLKAMPDDCRFYNELGVCLCRLGRVREGFHAYEQGLNVPTCTDVVAGKIYTNIGNAYSFLGDIPASIENSIKGYQKDPANTTAMQNHLMNLLYVPNASFSETLKQHFEVGTMYAKQMTIKEYAVAPYSPIRQGPQDKIRLGFVSGDFFGEHPMTYFLKSLLTCWDRNRFKLYCYSNQKIGRTPFYSSDIEWRDIKYLDCKNVCNMITKEDEIDVLIDLAGHTACNRLDIFSNRCARIQMSYLGYPCITGVPNVDYYIVDKTFDMRIKTIAMPHCFTHYWPASVPAADTLVSPFHQTDSEGFFCMGTLNKLAKVNQAMVDTWDCLLDEFPNTKLLIRRNYVFKFRNQDRVVSLEHETTYQGHMSRYNKIDIALDTAPYSGTTTTCESMIMGTPVITLADRKNKTIHQNVSASLLINSDMGHLVVESLDDYKRVIRSLMEEIAADKEYKQKVQQKFLQGSVCNKDQYMQDFETLVSDLHKKKAM